MIKFNSKCYRFSYYLVVLFVITSCSNSKYLNQDIIKRNYQIDDYLYNDSIKVAIDFYGQLDNINLLKTKKSELKKELKGFDNLSVDKLFFTCNSKINDYKIYLFYDKIEENQDSITQVSILKTNPDYTYSIIEKQKGNTKITTLVKSKTTKKEYTLEVAKDVVSKINIGSFDKNKLSYFKIFQTFVKGNHNYLQAREKLKTAPLDDKKHQQFNDVKFQFIATSNSFLSNNPEYNSFLLDYEKKRKTYFNKTVNDIYSNDDVFKNNKVFDEIGLVAKNNSVIILNEDHYYPKHRIFAMQLLDVLKQNGYSYLSLEAFSIDKENNLFPNYNNGFYTSEPYFGHFLRRARELGFTILGHENQDDSIDREIGQAKNVYRILQDDPKAKIFVYVGHGHLEEKREGKKWMAQHFSEISKVNPITINQAKIFADTNDEIVLIPRKHLEKDSLLNSSADYFLINNIKVDLKKVYTNSKFKSVTLKNREIKNHKNEELLIEVFDFYEYEKLKSLTLPIINLLATPKSKTIKVDLPLGKYYIKIKTVENKKIFEEVILVE